jgi:3-hydroxyacyl-CoA dehydrogenase
MHTGEDKGSQFAWKVFANTAIYAANRIPEIADDIVNIDNACKWGFAWEIGIFETWDALGFDYVCDRMEEDGLTLPPIAKAMKTRARRRSTNERTARRFISTSKRRVIKKFRRIRTWSICCSKKKRTRS